MAKPQGMDATTVASGAAATSGAAVSKARAGMAPAVDATAHVDAVDAAATRPEAAQEGAGGSWKQLKLHANTLRGGSGLEVALRWEASLAALRAYVDGMAGGTRVEDQHAQRSGALHTGAKLNGRHGA